MHLIGHASFLFPCNANTKVHAQAYAQHTCPKIRKWQLVNCHILRDLNKVHKYSLINKEIVTEKRSNTTQNGTAQRGIILKGEQILAKGFPLNA